MKSYKCLSMLKEKNINFTYIPFEQAAMVEILDEEWKGSCSALSWAWMYRKIVSENMQTATSYCITESHLPHPVIVDKNMHEKNLKDFITSLQESSGYNAHSIIEEWRIEGLFQDNHELIGYLNKNDKIRALLEFIQQHSYHYGMISSSLSSKESDKILSRHATAFVRREDAISYFDPNYGEINFSNFNDFSYWFENEITEGVLGFLIADYWNLKKYSDLFPSPSFTSEQIDYNTLTLQITDRRKKTNESRQKEDVRVREYILHSFFSPNYFIPDSLNKSTTPLPPPEPLVRF